MFDCAIVLGSPLRDGANAPARLMSQRIQRYSRLWPAGEKFVFKRQRPLSRKLFQTASKLIIDFYQKIDSSKITVLCDKSTLFGTTLVSPLQGAYNEKDFDPDAFEEKQKKLEREMVSIYRLIIFKRSLSNSKFQKAKEDRQKAEQELEKRRKEEEEKKRKEEERKKAAEEEKKIQEDQKKTTTENEDNKEKGKEADDVVMDMTTIE